MREKSCGKSHVGKVMWGKSCGESGVGKVMRGKSCGKGHVGKVMWEKSYNMPRAWVLGTVCSKSGEKTREPKMLQNLGKTSISCLARKTRPPDLNMVYENSPKTLGKANRLKRPRW